MVTDTEERNISGWRKQPDDPRDYQLYAYRPDLIGAFDLPTSIDLRTANQPPIQNQGALGSCVAWACVRSYRYAHRKLALPDFDGSELFTYYNARAYQGWQNEDTGSYLRDGIKALVEFGNAEESTWPYQIWRFAEKPQQSAYANATSHQATRYLVVPNIETSVKQVLANGYPVVFGIPIYQNFPMGNGIEIIPNPVGQVIGGHAMTVVGYDDARRAYLLANSWGDSWGNNGYAWMSYSYFTSQATDLWMIETVEGEPPPPPPPPPTNKVVDGIGLWTPEKGIVHLWPPRRFEEMDETVGGIGIHYTDGTTEGIWPKA